MPNMKSPGGDGVRFVPEVNQKVWEADGWAATDDPVTEAPAAAETGTED